MATAVTDIVRVQTGKGMAPIMRINPSRAKRPRDMRRQPRITAPDIDLLPIAAAAVHRNHAIGRREKR
jgi:hypothetical protein